MPTVSYCGYNTNNNNNNIYLKSSIQTSSIDYNDINALPTLNMVDDSLYNYSNACLYK